MNNLKRSNSDKIISGVCGGLGEFLNIDPTIIRVIWALFLIMSFTFGLLTYVFCSLIIPIDDDVIYSDSNNQYNEKTRKNILFLLGIGLIISGIYLLLKIIYPWLILRIVNLFKYWPILLIILGIYIIYNQKKLK